MGILKNILENIDGAEYKEEVFNGITYGNKGYSEFRMSLKSESKLMKHRHRAIPGSVPLISTGEMKEYYRGCFIEILIMHSLELINENTISTALKNKKDE